MVALDGLKVAALELGLGAQQSGVQELHDGLEVADVVFDGRAREGDAVVALQAAGRSGLLGEMVLDVLCLIEDDAAPRDGGQVVLVTVQGAVAGDHRLVVSRQAAEFLSLVAVRAMVQQHRQVGREPGGFPLPVVDHRSWADDEVGTVVALLEVQLEGGQGGGGFPSPMSSARQAPSPHCRRKASHEYPSR